MTVHHTRAPFVSGLVEEYARRVGVDLNLEGIDTVARDMIGDLMHAMVATSGDRLAALDSTRLAIELFVTRSSLTPSELATGVLGEPATVSIGVGHGYEMWLSATNVSGKIETADMGLSLDF